MTRIKHSNGGHYFNDGGSIILNREDKYEIDSSRKFYLFDIIPIGAPRMTQSDRWKTNSHHSDPKKRQRTAVTQYFSFKDKLKIQAKLMGFQLYDYLDAVYFMPMPNSWSEKKKDRMNGLPCTVKPDTDNITKALKDTLLKNDSCVWYEKAEKRWAYRGAILIFV